MNNLLCGDCGAELEEGECVYCSIIECRIHGYTFDCRVEPQCPGCYDEYVRTNERE